MIIVVGGIKGGSGKTTLATNLVVLRSQSKSRNTLFIDADELKSSTDWQEQRESQNIASNWIFKQLSGSEIHLEIKKIEDQYDDIIIDVGGRDTRPQRACLMIADIFLIPFRPRVPDLWTLDALETMVNPILRLNKNLKCIPCINQGDATGKDNFDSLVFLHEYGFLKKTNIIIHQRKSFHNAYSQGLGVIEMKKQDPKAVDELQYLYSTIFK